MEFINSLLWLKINLLFNKSKQQVISFILAYNLQKQLFKRIDTERNLH